VEAGGDLARHLTIAAVDRKDPGLAHGSTHLVDRAVDDLVDPEVRGGVERRDARDAVVGVELQAAGLRRVDAALLLERALAGFELLRDRDLVAGKDDATPLLHIRTPCDAGCPI